MDFGECVECGGDIELKRLEAIPWVRYCMKCQEVREQGGGGARQDVQTLWEQA
jgi:RNA polymerase-binding transcription factor DksA